MPRRLPWRPVPAGALATTLLVCQTQHSAAGEAVLTDTDLDMPWLQDIIELDKMPPGPIVIKGDATTCVWPSCTKHLVPCETKKVGTCVMPPHVCYNKQAVCEVGRCNCPHGYCTMPGTKKCEPQYEYEGARPPPFQREFWLRLFMSMGREDQFPKLWELEDNWMGLISPRCIPALVLLLFGITVSWITGMVMCSSLLRCKCLQRANVNANLVLCELRVLDNMPLQRHRKEKEPHCWPAVALMIMVIFCNVWAVTNRNSNWDLTALIMIDQATRLKANALELQDDAIRLGGTASNMSAAFAHVANCKYNPTMSWVGSMALNSSVQLEWIVNTFKETVEDIPGACDEFVDMLKRNKATAVWMPCLPLEIMAVLCFLMIIEVFFIRYFASSSTARFQDKGLAFCAGLFQFMIFLVAVFSSCLLSVLIGLSQICDEIDDNLLTYASEFANQSHEIVLNTSRFYIKGDVYNPLLGLGNDVRKYINTVRDLWYEFKSGIVDPQSLSCRALNELDVDEIHNVTFETLGTAREILNATNIYSYYEETIHKGICNHVPESGGQFILFQVFIGLICFPICAIFTHHYLSHHVGNQGGLWTEDEVDTDSDSTTKSSAVRGISRTIQANDGWRMVRNSNHAGHDLPGSGQPYTLAAAKAHADCVGAAAFTQDLWREHPRYAEGVFWFHSQVDDTDKVSKRTRYEDGAQNLYWREVPLQPSTGSVRDLEHKQLTA